MSKNWPKTIKRVARRWTSWYWNASLVFQYIDSQKLQNLTVLEDEELIDYLVDHKKSLIRWGDGESAILYGSDIKFQDYHPELKNEMLHFLRDHANSDRFTLGIPHQFVCFTLEDYKKQSPRRQNMWRTTRYITHKFCTEAVKYGDALLFRPYSNVDNSDFEKLWGNKHVVLISSEPEHAEKISEKTNANSVHQIKIPSKNLYGIIDQVENDCIHLLKDLNYDKEDIRVLISGGPAGKVLAHRLIVQDYRVYDVGHYFTWKVDGKTNKKGI